MDVIIHNRIEALEEIIPGYKQLKDEFREITMFQNVEWLKNWLNHKKKSKDVIPYIVDIRKENETIGVIPLYLSDKEFANIRFRILRPIGVDHSNYLIPILSKRFVPEQLIKIAMEKIYEDKRNWDCIHWGDLPKGSNFDSFFFNFRSHEKNKLVCRRKTSISPRLFLNKDFEKVREKYDQKLVKEILKKERRLKRDGRLTYNRVKEEAEIEPIMNAFFDMHCKRWANTDTPSRYELE